jgi:predicted permease
VLAYRLLLRLFPRSFRREFGPEMLATFRQALEEQRCRSGATRALIYTLRECRAAVAAAYREHRPRRTRSARSMLGFSRDLRLTLNALRRSPGFAAVAVATLSLGMAVNLVLFSMLNAVRRPELPYSNPDRLVVINEAYPPYGWTQQATSLRTFRDLQTDVRSFAAVAAYSQRRVSLSGRGVNMRVQSAIVSSELWSVLGVRPIVGRSFDAAEDRPGAAPTVMISASLWKERFGSVADLQGLRVTVDGVEREIVGVMPPALRFPETEELWIPLGSMLQAAPPAALNDRSNRGWQIVGRLRPGVTEAAAVEELRALALRNAEAFPDTNRDWTLTAIPIEEDTLRAVGSFFAALQAGGILLALIMCGNLGNLLLARGEQRRRELAICASLGATRASLLRLLMLEISVLTSVAMGAAILIAGWAITAVPLMIPEAIPFYIRFRIDAAVLAFAAALASTTAIAAGLAAAFRATAGDPYPVLVGSASSLVATGRASRTRTALLFTQTAMACALLASALVVGRGLMRFQAMDLGFDPRTTLMVEVPLPLAKYADASRIRTFSYELIDRVSTVADVRTAGISSPLPLFAERRGAALEIEVDGRRTGIDANPGTYRAVTPAFFTASGIDLLQGRAFTMADTAGAEPVVIINTEAARRIFKTDRVLGRKLRFGQSADTRMWHTVIGVVENTTEQPLDPEIEARLFVPFDQQPGRAVTLTVRTAGPPEAQSRAVAEAVRHTDPSLAAEEPISGMRRLSTALWPVRFFSLFAALFSAFGLAVACGGVYGLTRYLTLARTKEIALRLALGAGTRTVFAMMVRQNGAPVLAGLLAGGATSVGITNVLQHVMVGMPATDLLATTIAMTTLAAAAGLAIAIPAARVARVRPADALRAQ